MAGPDYAIGGLTLRPGRELRDNASSIALGARALGLLTALAEANGKVLTKDDLFAAGWASGIVEENALHAQISAARKALGREGRRLVTVHGRGYRLDLEPVALQREAEPEKASIAVLPFENLTANAEHAYLADGLAEELISRLAQVSGLKVPARTSSFAYRGQAIDIRTIAAELGVATVLEGSVRASGERVRIAAQLIDAASGFHIWSDSFDHMLTDLLDLQDDLAAAIAAALRRELGPRIRETHSAEAMRLVLQARAASRALTSEGMREAVRLARAAIELDPSFAKAWESLAGSTLMTGIMGFAGTKAFAEARGHAQHALELDPSQGGAHGIIAGVEAVGGKLVEAVDQLAHARALDPENLVTEGHSILNMFLPVGLNARATQAAERMISLAPARGDGYLLRALCASLKSDMADARRHLDAASQRGHRPARPAFEAIEAEIALAAGDFRGAALPHVRLAVRELGIPGAGSAMEAVFSALAGECEPATASRVLDELLNAADQAETLWAHTGNLAIFVHWQARLGMHDAAFSAARRIVEHWRESGRFMVGSLIPLWSPHMAPFRRDPRFQDLVRDLDLFRFWECHGPPDGHALQNGRLISL